MKRLMIAALAVMTLAVGGLQAAGKGAGAGKKSSVPGTWYSSTVFNAKSKQFNDALKSGDQAGALELLHELNAFNQSTASKKTKGTRFAGARRAEFNNWVEKYNATFPGAHEDEVAVIAEEEIRPEYAEEAARLAGIEYNPDEEYRAVEYYQGEGVTPEVPDRELTEEEHLANVRAAERAARGL